MIQQEEIRIKQFTTGVTFSIFSDTIYNQLPENLDEYEGPFPSYLVSDLQGEFYSLNFFTGGTIWTRNNNNNYINIGELGWNYITGYTLIKTIVSDLSQETIDNMSNLILSRLSDPTRPGSSPEASTARNYVFHKKKLIDDFYVDLKLERSYNSLDTLKINNNLLNSFPEQNSSTGVVFGRLTAVQKVKGENGQNLRIPLRNVPIGIFNPSNDFPNTFSTDDNGNRISLNLKEASFPNEYFDSFSYNSDFNSYLRSAETFSSIPSQYKYVTQTNDNGEFIIYDVPIGEQIVIFEVDLFKQGLTKDEIALNFFPFPPTEDPNIDTIPSFVFKQFPIDVVPAWGLGQTGYTTLDVNINLDLRKWATYILPPVTFNEQKLNETVVQNPSRTLKVDVRDMTSPNFEIKPLEIVQIPNDLDRDVSANFLWFNEFAQKKTSIQYSEFGCHVFKLPGNIYDPTGYKTDKDGNPTKDKGVWLAAYQLNIYIDKTFSQRTTGTVNYYDDNGSLYTRSHFYLNYTNKPNSFEEKNPQIGTYPYEKPWSYTYPVPYSIPKKPTKQRISNAQSRTLYQNNPAVYYVEEPAYYDGDLIGTPVFDSAGGAGGFGVQFIGTTWFNNRIANVATNSYMYKYEKGVAWSETYANGYEPYWSASNNPYSLKDFPFAGISSVVEGESYQRLECGYGYFLKPYGWMTIARAPWYSDVPLDTLKLNESDSKESPSPSIAPNGVDGEWFYRKQRILSVYNLNKQNFSLHLGSGNLLKEGGLDFYRIVESSENNISKLNNFIIPTSINLATNESHFCADFFITNLGEIDVVFKNASKGIMVNSKTGEKIQPGGYIKLKPLEFCYFDNTEFKPEVFTNNAEDSSETFDSNQNVEQMKSTEINKYIKFTNFNLPGNAEYDNETNRYTKANYKITVKYYYNNSLSEEQQLIDLKFNAKEVSISGDANVDGTQKFYVRTETNRPGSSTGLVHEGITKDFEYGETTYYNNKKVKLVNLRVELSSVDLYYPQKDGGTVYRFGYYL